MPIPTFTASGAKATTAAKLDASVFAVEVKNHQLLQDAYLSFLANGRENLAKTKTRGAVRGGGRKPWKQKGTGRARFGSSRNPIWRGGGITFGPTGSENYSRRLSTVAKSVATRQALSLQAGENRITVIEDIVLKNGKTQELSGLLTKIKSSRRTLVVVDQKTPELIRASHNLESVDVIGVKYLNVYRILNADTIIMTKKALAELTTRLKQEA